MSRADPPIWRGRGSGLQYFYLCKLGFLTAAGELMRTITARARAGEKAYDVLPGFGGRV